MSGWLSRAKSLFQQTLSIPEPFEVECDCGGKVVGQRTASYQRPICSVCERPVFVLPLNVYPRSTPKSKPKDKLPKSDSELKATRSSPNVVVNDNPVESPAKSPGRAKAPQSKATPSAPVVEPVIALEPRSPFFTPLRLIATAIILVSGLTVAGLWYRVRIENAKSTVASANDAGMAALRERDFPKAASELDRARRAVDLLGRKDHTAQEIRRFSREATTLSKLASSSLSEFLQDTLSNGKPDQTEPLRMSSFDKDAWVIFDSALISAEVGRNLYFVDAPIMFREGSVRIEVESPAIGKALQAAESIGVPRIIFAAQLEKLMPLTGDPPTAVLTLNGKTAFLWTSYDTYAAVGYRPIDDEDERQTKAILERQYHLTE